MALSFERRHLAYRTAFHKRISRRLGAAVVAGFILLENDPGTSTFFILLESDTGAGTDAIQLEG